MTVNLSAGSLLATQTRVPHPQTWFRRLLSGSLKRLTSGGPRAPISPGARFLFLQYETALGTAALATATFAALKARLPSAHITVAAAGLTANALRASPYIDELVVTPHAVKAFPAALRTFLIVIRRRRFDYAITDGGNRRGKIAILAWLSGARQRVGITLWPDLFHVGLTFDPTLSNVANNLKILEILNLPGSPIEPAIYFQQADLLKAKALLGPDPSPPRPRIAMVTQTSKGHPNAWFDDRWVALANGLTERLDAELVLVGTAQDAAEIEDLRAQMMVPGRSVAGQTDLPELAAVLSQCDLVITLDTGTMHVTRAVQTPAVILAHAANPKHIWLPLDDNRYRVLLKDYVPCSYCRLPACATRECMQEISVKEVIDSACEHLRQFPPTATARAARAAARLLSPL